MILMMIDNMLMTMALIVWWISQTRVVFWSDPEQIRDVLLPHPPLGRPKLASCQEQDVQEGVHKEYKRRCRCRRWQHMSSFTHCEIVSWRLHHGFTQPWEKELSSVGRGLEEDLYGSLYDNIFLRGHIGRSPKNFKRVNLNKIFSADEERPVDQGKQQFVPGYLALFL